MNHMMIDLETLDTQPSAVVVSFGGVVFNKDGILRTMRCRLDIKEQIVKGRTVSGQTIEWWMKQSDDARAIFNDGGFMKQPLDIFGGTFSSFFDGVGFTGPGVDEKLHLWGNGADFDLSIMMDLWRRHQLPTIKNWSYSKHMCFRTMNNLYNIKKGVERKGTYHDALDDAVYQAECLIASGKL